MTANAIKIAIAEGAEMVGYRGFWDASGDTFPIDGDGSGEGGQILEADFWRISVAGTLPAGGTDVVPGDLLFARIDRRP